ncbi:MAG: endonuclease domain-containing protein [Pirellulales bacterium]
MLSSSPFAFDIASLALSRHQERRRQGVPTLTVLAQTNDDAVSLVRRWADSAKRTVRVTSSERSDLLSSWFAAFNFNDVNRAAYEWLARRTGRDAAPLSLEISRRSPQERTMFLNRTLGAPSISPVDAICRALVELCNGDAPGTRVWDCLLHHCASDPLRVASGVIGLVGHEQIPVLLITADESNLACLRSIFTSSALLAAGAPALPIVVAATRERIEEYLATTPECLALALVREGLLWLSPGQDAAQSNGARDLHAIARLERGNGELKPDDDAARSAAERYLYERLEAHAETAGLFELNGLLAGTDGGRALEIDLLARRVRVAVEIDGYYHFTDLDAYRRDRQKDLWLQHAGYFVVRCLADDVTSRLEEILDAIIAAVRRPMSGQGSAVA